MRTLLSCLFLSLAAPATARDDAVARAAEAFAQGRHEAALTVIEPAARAGDPQAQVILGTAYDTGRGKGASAQLARDWFTRAAGQGAAAAQLALAIMAIEGRPDMPPDPQAALGWLEQAMAQGEPRAFLTRAQMMLDGVGGPANPAAAAALLITALELGTPQAGMVLADLYATGRGVPQDAARARATLARTARLGHRPAMAQLAVMYELGQGGPADPVAAFALYQEAVNLGDASAAVNLALFMQQTDGYWTDPALAHAYCLWGSRNAPPDLAAQYETQCAALAGDLTDDQRAEGARLAATF